MTTIGIHSSALCLLYAFLIEWMQFFAMFAQEYRELIITNSCSETIWVAAIMNNDTFYPQDQYIPVWWQENGELPSGQTETLRINGRIFPSARLWARTKCDFTPTLADGFVCATGSCSIYENCQTFARHAGRPESGQPGVTLVEMTLQDNGPDFYDVSAVDGFSIPVSMRPKAPFSKVDNPGIASALNCGIAGSCFSGMSESEWTDMFLEGCPTANKMYGNTYNTQIATVCQNYNSDMCSVGSTSLCIPNNSTASGVLPMSAFSSFCMSDAHLSSYLENERTPGPGLCPASSMNNWPAYADFPNYSCPGPTGGATSCPAGSAGTTCFTTCDCPANYHCPASGVADGDCTCSPPMPGVSPYSSWPEWFYQRCSSGAYGFTYDDNSNTYQCNTYGRSNAYLIEFCPKSVDSGFMIGIGNAKSGLYARVLVMLFASIASGFV